MIFQLDLFKTWLKKVETQAWEKCLLDISTVISNLHKLFYNLIELWTKMFSISIFFLIFFPWTVKLAFEEQGMKQQVLLSRYKYVMAWM